MMAPLCHESTTHEPRSSSWNLKSESFHPFQLSGSAAVAITAATFALLLGCAKSAMSKSHAMNRPRPPPSGGRARPPSGGQSAPLRGSIRPPPGANPARYCSLHVCELAHRLRFFEQAPCRAAPRSCKSRTTDYGVRLHTEPGDSNVAGSGARNATTCRCHSRRPTATRARSMVGALDPVPR